MNYANVSNIFSYNNTIDEIIRNSQSGTPEFYLKANRRVGLPRVFELLNYYALINGIAIYTVRYERITRSTGLDYYLNTLASRTRPEDDQNYYTTQPLLYTTLQREAFGLKDTCGVHIISVEGQIQDTFESAVPQWATRIGATEALGVSLALKLTPKHRVRVYTRDAHIIVFTTKGVNDVYENDYELYRKLWACLPLLRNWAASETSDGIATPELIELFKQLANSDSTSFWNMLEQAYTAHPTVQNLKYQTIISTFNNIQTTRISAYTRQINDYARQAESYLNNYTTTLEHKRDIERQLLEVQQSDGTIETDIIKRLVDKKICYNLSINNLTSNDGCLSYRCSAPLLSYDKDAAQVIYRKRVAGNYSDQMDWLFRTLFIDEKIVLHFDEAIDIKLNRGTIQAKSGCTNLFNDLDIVFPNPHHFHYNCWGSYAPVITRLINAYKLEEMFYQVKAAVGSINFTDYPVISKFLEQLSYIADSTYTPRCLSWRDEDCAILHTFQETINHFMEEASQ